MSSIEKEKCNFQGRDIISEPYKAIIFIKIIEQRLF